MRSSDASSAPNRLSALVGAVLFAGAGATMGSMNVGWFALERNANALFPLLGVGSGLVVIGFVRSDLKRELYRAGGFGRAARWLLVVGPVLMVVSGLVEFAIFGTLALGLGLVSLAVVVVRRRLLHQADRLLIAFSAVGSLTWNTETVSAFLLVGVGLLWAFLSMRVLTSSAGSEAEHLKMRRNEGGRP